MWSLKVIKGAELAEKLLAEVRLPEPLTRFLIGRDPGSTWPIVDRTLAISARHCEIVATPHGPALRDLSTNGTFVNDSAVRMEGDFVLRDGDRFEIGPFLIAVSGPPMPPRPAAVSVPAAPLPVRSAGVMDTAPRRGGDPAAMLAAGGFEKVGLTEILRVAAPAEDSSVDVTRIRLADPPAARVPSAAPAAPAAPAQAGAPESPLLAALARGLGLPVAALPPGDPLQLVEQLAAAARAAAVALRQVLEHQQLARRALGSRSGDAATHPLREGAAPEAALAASLARPGAAGQLLESAAAELRAHDDRLVRAFEAASKRLAQQMAPASVQASLADGEGDNAQAHWAAYVALWEALGLAPGQPWVAGFHEAARLHLAAAFDDQAPRHVSPKPPGARP